MATDNLDIGVDCDECGTHNNVMCDTWVNQRMGERGWQMNSEHGDVCPECVKKLEGETSDGE